MLFFVGSFSFSTSSSFDASVSAFASFSLAELYIYEPAMFLKCTQSNVGTGNILAHARVFTHLGDM